MRHMNADRGLFVYDGHNVVSGFLVGVSVASTSTAYVGRQRMATFKDAGAGTTPWRLPLVDEVSEHHVSLLDMVKEMKEGGFPVASIAQFVGVERKTVYSWLDGGATPNPDREERVAKVYSILKERFEGDFGLMYRVLRAKSRDGVSLESLFANEVIDVASVERQLAVLNSSIESIKASEARKKAKPFKTNTGRNGAIEDSPVAVFQDI